MAKILVADNDRVVLFTLAESLRKFGFDVIETRDGLHAMHLCRTEAPDLVLLDVHLPGLDGLRIARRLRENMTIPFLFFSADNDEVHIEEARKIGAFGYMTKPINLVSIIDVIQKALSCSQETSKLHRAIVQASEIPNPTVALLAG
ncbi:MAG: response regulator [Betaproteobacteria bacterium]|nr:response regulator [Betaproteobacteria bacterium]